MKTITMKLEAVGDGDSCIFVGFGYRTDFMAFRRHTSDFLTTPLAAQHLEDARCARCENGHKHTCILSIVGDRSFGKVLLGVRATAALFVFNALC